MMLRRLASSPSVSRLAVARRPVTFTSYRALATTAPVVEALSGSANNASREENRRKFGLLAAAAGSALLASLVYNENIKTDCCGIAGVVGTPNHDAREFLLEGLTVLKNRGYDSAGLATMPTQGGIMVRVSNDCLV